MSRLFPICSRCNTGHFFAFLKSAHYVCSKCGYHMRLDAPTRLKMICDKRTFVPFGKDIKSVDVLNFPKYRDKLEQSMQETKINEAVITGTCEIKGHPTTIGVMEPNFIMASMGSAVGEKITRQLELAVEAGLPAV
ncbi:MAG TPA: hypothetical protein VK186_10355, partial [Candidatus Deferrimicrobium sp.]|nr:hypothetical protein [Candidatus Deferrimicrobium sp.]